MKSAFAEDPPAAPSPRQDDPLSTALRVAMRRIIVCILLATILGFVMSELNRRRTGDYSLLILGIQATYIVGFAGHLILLRHLSVKRQAWWGAAWLTVNATLSCLYVGPFLGVSFSWILAILLATFFGNKLAGALVVSILPIVAALHLFLVHAGWIPAPQDLVPSKAPFVLLRTYSTGFISLLFCYILFVIIANAIQGVIRKLVAERSNRQRAEHTASMLSARLDEVFEHSPFGIYLLKVEKDSTITLEDANPMIESVLGISREALNAMPPESFMGAAQVEIVSAALRKCIDTGAATEHETLIHSPKGPRIVRTDLFPIKDGTGRVCRLAAFVRDVTIKRQTLRALQESEEKFSRAFQASPDGIVISDLFTGEILDANEVFISALKRSPEQVIGKTSTELGIWKDEAARERFTDTLVHKGIFRNEFMKINTAPGAECTYHINAHAIDIQGRRCAISILRDVSEQLQVQQQKAETMEQNQRLNRDFTRRLILSQEAERRRIAGALHDSVGQDLLLIKNRILMAFGAAESPGELRIQMEDISVLANHAITEVRRMSHDLRPYQLDHLGLTRSLRGMLETAAKNSTCIITHKLEDVDDLFNIDAATDLYRITQEALNNIFKHSGANHVEITLERDVHEVILSIKDDGCGFQADTQVQGLGMGSMAERASMMGGVLRIESKPGNGTRVLACIPIQSELP